MSLFDTGVRPLIDEYLLNESKEVRDYGDYWSASSAGYCMRRVIFDRLKVPHVTEDARKQRVFSSGHIFHEWIQDITKKAGLSIAQEVELQDEDLMVRGHFDDLILIRYDENGETPVRAGAEQRGQHLILYDYKTQNSKGFATYAKKPSHHHKMQLGTYMYMLRKMGKLDQYWSDGETLGRSDATKDLTEARILKISKDDLRMAEVQYVWSEDLEADVALYWTVLNKFWADKKIPPCTCADHDGGWMAREAFNPFFYEGEPCSLDWYTLNKKETSNAK